MQKSIGINRIFSTINILLTCLFLELMFCTFTVEASKLVEINLAAGAGLKDCLNAQIALYKNVAPNIKITPNYEASGKLQEQIGNGAPVDLFISANQEKMDLLEKRNLVVKGTRINLVQNKIVLIAPKSRESAIHCFNCLGTEKLKDKGIAIGDPKVVPAGKYAVEVFKSLKISEKVMSKAVLAQTVRHVLTYVARGEADAGVVYYTDTLIMPDKVKIIAEAPEGSYSPAIFPAAVIATGNNPEGGKAFLKFLTSPEAIKVFKNFGYSIPKQ
ncbi:MAG: molybdate ABC transporter substrate-binding protein [Planctomycetaceae bacterium]|jgi:molybdate transport system substrate-binding protein|nr:molybdate ABC transporter substrate-binding protein [Planctomycetaceae bacterium]